MALCPDNSAGRLGLATVLIVNGPLRLATDPTKCPPEQIAAIPVKATWLKGKHKPILAQTASR